MLKTIFTKRVDDKFHVFVKNSDSENNTMNPQK